MPTPRADCCPGRVHAAASFCAFRVAGIPGAIVGGLGFVLPGAIVGGLGFVVPAVVLILALSVLFLGHPSPL